MPPDLRFQQDALQVSNGAEVGNSFPPIAGLDVVGDRQTAAVIAADGTVQWLCLPAFDGVPVFGKLLDPELGGYWRLGPVGGAAGVQYNLQDNNVLVTSWQSGDGEAELTTQCCGHREFDPRAISGALCCAGSLADGEAFCCRAVSSWLRCTRLWDRQGDAEAMLRQVEALTGDTGLFSEGGRQLFGAAAWQHADGLYPRGICPRSFAAGEHLAALCLNRRPLVSAHRRDVSCRKPS